MTPGAAGTPAAVGPAAGPAGRLVGRARLRSRAFAGLPDHVRAPLTAVLTGRLPPAAAEAVTAIEAVRSDLLARGEERVTLWPDGPGRRTVTRPIAHLATTASLTPAWGALLHLLADAVRAATVLELGSCVGLSGAYLATSPHCRRLVTVEGTPALAELAAATLGRLTDRAEVWTAAFDDVLATLPFPAPLDLVFVDGSKHRADNARWTEALLPHVAEGGLVVFDDIDHSVEMRRFWAKLRRRAGLAATVDAGRLGICIRGAGATAPRNYDLFRCANVDVARLERAWRRRVRRA